MSGVSGFKEEILRLKTNSRLAADMLHRQFVREILEILILRTWHSSSNAAFNWRVSVAGGSPEYFDFRGFGPVGEGFDFRSDQGDSGAITAVAAASRDRENRNTIDQLLRMPTVVFSNAIDEVSNKYVKNAELQDAIQLAKASEGSAGDLAKLIVKTGATDEIARWFN